MTTRRESKQKTHPAGELALIERIRQRAAPFRGRDVRLGIGDDCAIVQPCAGEEMLVTTDFSLEHRHFRRDLHPAASIGHRTLARGLSDIASMGARPVAAFLSLALPQSIANDTRWVGEFLDGFMELAKQFEVTLAGGDTAQSPDDNILADIVVIGAAPRRTALRRSGARPGDHLYCTGQLGGAALEWMQLEANPQAFRTARRDSGSHPHLFPEPRVAVGLALRKRAIATACLDVSDGLSTDLAHLCRASGVSAEVDFDALPRPQTHGDADEKPIEHCILHGGEDYELLFTARSATRVPKSIAGTRITRIGTILAAKPGMPLMTLSRSGQSSEELVVGGWEHLRG